MTVIPAIDLRSGRSVRLLRGDFGQQTVYSDDPIAVTRHWREAGAELVHVVDLDGAKDGAPRQLPLIKRLAATMPVQAGGGLRTEDDLAAALEAGARRVVVGTAALNPDFTVRMVETYGDRLVVALDARRGVVAVDGWTRATAYRLLDLARSLADAGVKRFLHTDVDRDGTLSSPNYESLEALIDLGIPVLASGGVASVEDVRRLREIGVEAVIVGRALSEGRIDLHEAVTVAR